MRVAYVCCDPGVPVFGCKGCSVHVQEVLHELLRRKAEVTLFAARVDNPKLQSLERVQVHRIEMRKHRSSASWGTDSELANAKLMQCLVETGPYDLVYERYSLYAWAAMEYAQAQQIPGVLEVNAPLIDEQARYRALADTDQAERSTDRVMNAAGAVVAVSDSVAKYVCKYRSLSSTVHVIPNGVDHKRFTHRANRNAFQGTTIGFVGTLKPWHGVADLLDAFGLVYEHIAPARLLLVGDGPERESLEHQASHLPGAAGQAVEFVGAVPPRQVPKILASMDLAVAPYVPMEEFYFSPLKLFEYMAAGLPVVASKVGQIQKVVQHEKTGLLYAPGDREELGRMVKRLVQQAELKTQLGAAAREAVIRDYTWSRVVDRILAVAHEQQQRLAAMPPPHFTNHASRSNQELTR